MIEILAKKKREHGAEDHLNWERNYWEFLVIKDINSRVQKKSKVNTKPDKFKENHT